MVAAFNCPISVATMAAGSGIIGVFSQVVGFLGWEVLSDD
jgi:hypothetical protein